MNYNIAFAKDVSKLCNTCIMYIILFITVLIYYQKSIPTPYWLLGIPLILVCYQFIQNYCFQPVIYILLHGIFWIPALLIPFSYVEYRYLFLGMLIFEGMNAIRVWKTDNNKTYDDIPLISFIVISLIYIVATHYHLDNFAQLIYYLGLGILLLHFIRSFITGITRLLTKSKEATSMPANQIISTSSFIFVFFLAIIVIAAIWLQHSNIDQLFTAIGEVIIRCLRFVLRLITYIATILKALFAKERQLEETEVAEEEMETALEELQEPSLLAKILDGIIIIAVVFVAIYIVYRLIMFFIKLFSKRYTQEADVVVQLSKPKETIQKTKTKRSILKSAQEFFKNDNATKVRRGYRLKIKGYKPAIFKTHDTPTEIAQRVELTYNEDIAELTHVYEKARYSDEEITFDDVQKGGLL